MLQYQVKLNLTKTQERTCEQWLYHLSSVYNWAVRKIELNAANKIYFSKMEFQNLLANHSERLDIPSHVLQGVLCVAFDAWKRCFKKQCGKPRLKSNRNKMTSLPFPDPIKVSNNRAFLTKLGKVKFHKMEVPQGKIKCGRVVKRASGWYLCLFIDAEPKSINRIGYGRVGIDPGFKNLLTVSDGEVIEHPREYEQLQNRLGQAQRGNNKRLVARLHEKISNKRRDRNHKLSHRLVAENIFIAFSKDKNQVLAKRFGKSVTSSGHSQLRQMLSYKSPRSGTKYVEVDSKFSTKTCSECGSLSGPSGFAGLSVRQWVCSECGTVHDRDVNAAINTLKAGAGCAHERYAHA